MKIGLRLFAGRISAGQAAASRQVAFGT